RGTGRLQKLLLHGSPPWLFRGGMPFAELQRTQTDPTQELADSLLYPDSRAVRTRSLKGLPRDPWRLASSPHYVYNLLLPAESEGNTSRSDFRSSRRTHRVRCGSNRVRSWPPTSARAGFGE